MKNILLIHLKKRYLLLCIFTVIVGACESLEEEPLTKVSTDSFYTDEVDANAALTGAYARLKSSNGYYKQAFLSVLFASSDQGVSTYLLKEFKTGTVVNTNTDLTRMWSDIYVAIRDANNVIANVQTIDMDESLKLRIIGEARFLRALHYFNLVRCFGEVPLRIEPLKAGDDEGLPVSSIQDVFAVIVTDLEFAAENCWGRNEIRNKYSNDLGRATKTAAHALLAKAYLRIASCKRTAQGGVEGNNNYLAFSESIATYYQLAKEQCDLALKDSGFQLTSSLEGWKTIFSPDNGNNPEMIFEVQGSSIVGQGTAVSNLFSPKDSGLSGT
ncbi:RagB/SusD family nutrient uptake outer membrane protein, partial [uncultured Polaribacter sp.]|uniref:RagB/SusD family nutrient uptake outer membrane protein n=1 Tax=uncultured Polaribacter sp. TaxID=174711 RepID=UPI00261860FF